MFCEKSIIINFINTNSCEKLRPLNTKQSSEQRFLVGYNESEVDEYFFDKNKNCLELFFLKQDLIDYLMEAKDEYFSPSQTYKYDISKFYYENLEYIKNIPYAKIQLQFYKKVASGNRCYLGFLSVSRENKKKYDYLRNILLPQITQLCFYKIKLDDKYVIYLKPVLK